MASPKQFLGKTRKFQFLSDCSESRQRSQTFWPVIEIRLFWTIGWVYVEFHRQNIIKSTWAFFSRVCKSLDSRNTAKSMH